MNKEEIAAQGTPMRTYTASEINDLRHALEMRWLFGTSVPAESITSSRCYRQEDKDEAVDKLVQKAMLLGHTAEDIHKLPARYGADEPAPTFRPD